MDTPKSKLFERLLRGPNYCPKCDALLDDASALTRKEAEPRAGDLSVCVYCATLLRFTEGGGLRKLEDEEFKKLPVKQRRQLLKVQNAATVALALRRRMGRT